MQCKHPYYHYVDGQLVCTQCGAPSPKIAKSEDKIAVQHETKSTKPNTKRS